jgi:DNA-binding LacI/PurR family transcriptional regulator
VLWYEQNEEGVEGGVTKPNLALIARKCGVSKMTVSRVLRGKPNVSPATRESVLGVAEKVGFQPSGNSHEDDKVSTRNYVILFQSEYSQKDAFFSGIILTVQRELFAQGFNCSVGIVKNEYSEFLKLNRLLHAHQIHGILVVGDIAPHYADALQANFHRLVFIDYPGDAQIKCAYNAVCVDNVYGGQLAVNHLLTLGRKRILLISGRGGHYFSNDLLRAYKDTLESRRIEVDPRLILNGDFHVKSGFKVTKAALEAGVKFDAIFSNDEMACGAIKALKLAGLRVPQDVSVVGFDGLPMGEVISPALTTVAVDRDKLGRLAVRRLLAHDQASGDDEKFEKICIFPQLLVRESCGATVMATV